MSNVPQTRSRPLLIFDGECGFCRRWVERGRSLTGERVDYAPSQEVAAQFPHITPEQFKEAAWLILPDGTALRGAAAIFRALQEAPGRGWMYGAYRRIPGFAGVSEACYTWVARHRPFMSRMTNVLYGAHTARPTYENGVRVFLRLLGVVYLIAFWSAWSQVPGLLGRGGILPAEEFLKAAAQHFGPERYWRIPTLCWWMGATDNMLGGLCGGGVLVSILLVLGLVQGPCLLALWAMYLSFIGVGQDFFSFQWDTLLLETGLLAVLVAPWRLRSWRGPPPNPPRVFVWLLRLLLFKLMFLSGATKLTYGDAMWHDLTALTYHYETQPLPTWIGWHAHQLPRWFQQFSCAVMYVIELALPFFIFGPRRTKQLAFVGFLLFQVLIGLTGNYNFFNILTVALCFVLLDDATLSRGPVAPLSPAVRRPAWRRAAIGVTAIFIVTVSAAEFCQELTGRDISPGVSRTLSYVRPFRSINGYGLFRVMTTTRPEIVLEGSDDGRTWIEYEFQFKPGDLKKAPGFVEPHQPRLDWQMWFAALAAPRYPPWFARFAVRLLEKTPGDTFPSLAVGLLAKVPFPDRPPKYLRAVLYRYNFTTRAERAATGEWWKRERQGLYLPPISLEGLRRN